MAQTFIPQHAKSSTMKTTKRSISTFKMRSFTTFPLGSPSESVTLKRGIIDESRTF